MTERGAWVTEYIHCPLCFAVVHATLLQDPEKYWCGVAIPSWEPTGDVLPILAGKVGAMSSGGEVDTLEDLLSDAPPPCHAVRIVVLCDNGTLWLVVWDATGDVTRQRLTGGP